MAQGSETRNPVHFYNSKNNPYFMVFFQKALTYERMYSII